MTVSAQQHPNLYPHITAGQHVEILPEGFDSLSLTVSWTTIPQDRASGGSSGPVSSVVSERRHNEVVVGKDGLARPPV